MNNKQQLTENIVLFRTARFFNVEKNELTRSEMAFLVTIDKLPKPLIARNLSEYFGCTKVYSSKVINKLINKDYITASASDNDKRQLLLDTTVKGQDFLKSIYKDYMDLTTYLYDKLGSEKAKEFTGLLEEANKIIREFTYNN